MSDELKSYTFERFKQKITAKEFDDIVGFSPDTTMLDARQDTETITTEQEDKPKRKRLHKQKYVKVFMPDEIKDILKAKAGECSMPLSKYLKTTGLAQEIKPPISADVRKNIAGFGRLLNQCATVANSTGTIHADSINELKYLAMKIIKMIRKETR